MLRNTWLIVLLVLFLLTAGCTNAPAPPPETRAADVQAVKDVEAAWVKDTAAKDFDKWVNYFAEDGSAMYTGMSTLNGKAAIRAAIQPMFGDPNFSLAFQSTKMVASKGGDMVLSQGTYTMTMTNPKTKKP